jgi:hypothetical protein
MTGRPVVYSPAYVHSLFAGMRDELAELGAQHVAEVARLHRQLDDLRAELDATKAAFDELRSVSLARQRAEAELRELYRERLFQRARAAERDPVAPLH